MLERDFGYKPPIPEELQRQYETALHGVLRWKNGNWADSVYETDWDHVTGMFFVLQDINKICPTLSSDVNVPTIKHMIYLHDAGEILVGDLTHNRDDYYDLYDRWKTREHAAFRILTKEIKDENIKNQSRQLYKRYVTQNPTDKEALLTRLIDTDQGLRFGFANVFNGRGMKISSRQMQFNRSVELIRSPSIPLLQVVSPETQIGLKSFLRDELERFFQYGYRRQAAPYIKNLDVLLT